MDRSVYIIKTYHRSKVSFTLTRLTSVMTPASTDTICPFNPLYPAETGRGSFPVCEKSITLRCSAHKSYCRLNGVQSMLSDHQPWKRAWSSAQCFMSSYAVWELTYTYVWWMKPWRARLSGFIGLSAPLTAVICVEGAETEKLLHKHKQNIY